MNVCVYVSLSLAMLNNTMEDVDISNLCRLCAQISDSDESVFCYNEDIDIISSISKFLCIKIAIDDDLPTIMCNKCRAKVTSFNKFYNMCAEAQSILRNILNHKLNGNTKFEDVEMKLDSNLLDVKIEPLDHVKCEEVSDFDDDGHDDQDDYIPISHFLDKENHVKDDSLKLKFNFKKSHQKSRTMRKVKTIEQSQVELEETSKSTMRKGKKSLSENSFLSFFCKHCNINFGNWAMLKKHTREQHNSKAKVLCICDKYLQTRNSINRHILKHGVTTSMKCENCNKTFPNAKALKIHSIVHLPKDQYPHVCSECNKRFATFTTLKLHKRTHIPKELRYVHPCEVCGVKFTSKSSVKSHISAVHDKIKPYVCDVCGHAFNNKGNLSEHRLLHGNEKLYACPKCPKKFKTKGTLQRHVELHQATSYQCPECPALLNSRRTLKMHMYIHNDVCRYICAFCNKGYKRRKSLKSHMNIHTGERPFSCPWCSRTFADNSNCRIHKKRMHPVELAKFEAENSKPQGVVKDEVQGDKKIILCPNIKLPECTQIVVPLLNIKPDLKID